MLYEPCVTLEHHQRLPASECLEHWVVAVASFALSLIWIALIVVHEILSLYSHSVAGLLLPYKKQASRSFAPGMSINGNKDSQVGMTKSAIECGERKTAKMRMIDCVLH